MLKLRLQYFGHLMQKVDSLERILCNGRGPNLEWRQEPQRSSRDFTGAGLIRIAKSLQSWERRVRTHLVWRNGNPLASRVVHGVTG